MNFVLNKTWQLHAAKFCCTFHIRGGEKLRALLFRSSTCLKYCTSSYLNMDHARMGTQPRTRNSRKGAAAKGKPQRGSRKGTAATEKPQLQLQFPHFYCTFRLKG
ncbi:hypothetical protein POVWA2_025870 [Plasmodium ovale wallikeri]|uniref:Uncharacterized protein n=1 Tax=Plasmodium ovale wallikeri TaxID=864142 RepID=A0A1A8YU36_PLAOA|nr:hypothetical protein POVWA1_026040 [Plasmodium ovale wallikeri]SBT35616.1 hypothetical protein POVWA2_025870 [Plasmodium ovale wallikeri]